MAENKQAPAADEEMVSWQGKFGGNVDGWWSPPEGKRIDTLKGILVHFISKDRSEKLQSNSLVFELTEPCEHVKNGGSEKIGGAKGDGKLYTAPVGALIGVPEWKQLEGMWPKKAGHKVQIARSGEKRNASKGRSMYPIDVKMSPKPVRYVEVDVDDTDGGDEGVTTPDSQFQVEAAS